MEKQHEEARYNEVACSANLLFFRDFDSLLARTGRVEHMRYSITVTVRKKRARRWRQMKCERVVVPRAVCEERGVSVTKG